MKNLPGKVLHWDDERRLGNGYIITLKPGWRWEQWDSSHTRGFDTQAEIRGALKDVVKCDCQECQRVKA
jgi:hypothetical protein